MMDRACATNERRLEYVVYPLATVDVLDPSTRTTLYASLSDWLCYGLKGTPTNIGTAHNVHKTTKGS